MSTTDLYETTTVKWMLAQMCDPPGNPQDEDVVELLKFRKDIDDEISKLVKQRKEFNDLISKNCTHPNERRARESYYLTDTIRLNGWNNVAIICRDCGKTLRKFEE